MSQIRCFICSLLLCCITISLRAQTVLPPFNKDYNQLNNTVWGYRNNPLTGTHWELDMFIYPKGNYTLANVSHTSNSLGGLVTQYGIYHDGIHEWDYSYHNLNGMWSGDGWFIVSGPYKGYTHPPVNRADAYTMLRGWFIKQTDSLRGVYPNYLRSTTGHILYQHYGARWAGNKIDMVSCEIGENIKSTQVHIAFTRGAARQYNKPWGLQFSPWFGPGILDYSVPGMWAESGSNNGHSLPMFRRSYYLSFMAGANTHHLEAANVNWFSSDSLNASGNFSLSPLGTIGKEFYNVAQRIGDNRGIPYTPYAIVLDSLHGINQYPTAWLGAPQYKDTSNVMWQWFDPIPGDIMTGNLLNTIWPGSFENLPNNDNEQRFYLNATPYGDVADVFTEDVSGSVLQRYPVVWLSGNITVGGSTATTLQQYVSGGGTLIINAAQTGSLGSSFTGVTTGSNSTVYPSKLVWVPRQDTVTWNGSISVHSASLYGATALIKAAYSGGETTLATVKTYGNGRVIVTLSDYLQEPAVNALFLKELNKELMPVTVTGNVEYLVNRCSDGWNITVINNNGVSKTSTTPTVIDGGQQQTVNITYTLPNSQLTGVQELISQQGVSYTGNSWQDVIGAGDVKIYHITTGATSSGHGGNPQYQLAPNPASDYTLLKIPAGSEVRTRGFSLSGRMIPQLSKRSVQDIRYNLNGLPCGLYLLVVTDIHKRKETVLRLLKQ
ncbi:hypothetical protein [Chitinophaga arvensicola]|uniref:Por secretion system C-terminal sorting domain-containing protein n=1 Tax=Chitinophaga arvensicola TaxID=29529 RepID=A0A1I0SCQ9_9BACT|nr:hypothetical protein [Chitinophaga arvensicola]SEW55351.1 hypothetical protein SAMN04488122_6368 [Chitinophaga arvensicola]